MIIRNRENWWRLLFVWNGSVLPQLLPRLGALLVISLVVTATHGRIFQYNVPLTTTSFTLFGVTLAIFLSFYNNASYDRFWEARKQWGALLNTTRSLTRQALTLAEPAAAPDFVRQLIAFTYALKYQLRHTDPAPDLARLLPPALAASVQQATFRPIRLLLGLGQWVRQGRETGQFDAAQQLAFDHNLNQLSDIVGACERLAGTPIPFTYSVVLHRTVYFYSFLLPFGLVGSTGWATPLVVVFMGYTFMALDAIMRELEQPFSQHPNALALNSMSHFIESTLLEMLGEPAPPPPAQPAPYLFN